jgi:hypothetical protein
MTNEAVIGSRSKDPIDLRLGLRGYILLDRAMASGFGWACWNAA